jgi:hypothetical protein
MKAKPGKAEIDRQGLVEFGAAIVEKIGRIGDRRGDPVADRVDGDRALVEKTEVEQLELELAAIGAKKGLIRAESDVAPGVEVEFAESLGKRGRSLVEVGGRKIARAPDDAVEFEFGRRRWLGRQRVRGL